METQTFINFGFTFAGILGGWILKTVWEEIKLLQRNQREIERNVHDNYVKRDDYKADIAEIKTMLARIFDKLDQKVDK
jgi:hypothetical protein